MLEFDYRNVKTESVGEANGLNIDYEFDKEMSNDIWVNILMELRTLL